jgi:hypothetical protein
MIDIKSCINAAHTTCPSKSLFKCEFNFSGLDMMHINFIKIRLKNI